VRTQFDGVSWQRCWTHFMRNALAKVGHKHKDALAKELKAARTHDTLETCMSEAERIAERWEGDYPQPKTTAQCLTPHIAGAYTTQLCLFTRIVRLESPRVQA
jgi:transposase-like protein